MKVEDKVKLIMAQILINITCVQDARNSKRKDVSKLTETFEKCLNNGLVAYLVGIESEQMLKYLNQKDLGILLGNSESE